MAKKKIQALVAKLAAHDIFGQLRYFKKDDGEIYFVAVDVCKILGYKNSRDALAKHVDDEDKIPAVAIRYVSSNGVEQTRKVTLINESGLYSLIFNSQLPTAKKFKRWVTSEVLPSIRKYGKYELPRKSLPEKKVITQEEILKKFFELYPDAEPEITDISFSEDENGNVITHYHVGYKLPDGNFIDPEKAAEKIFHM